MTEAEIQALREKRAKLIVDARALLDKARAETRDLTKEEESQYDVMLADAEKQKKTIDREERQVVLDRELEEGKGRRSDPDDPNPGNLGDDKKTKGEAREFKYTLRSGRERVFTLAGPRSTPSYRSAFGRYLRGGMQALNGEEARALGASTEEQRALQADSDTAGGFLTAPQDMAAAFIQAVDDLVFVRQYANVLPPLTSAESLGVPSLETDIADPDWTVEIATGGEDSDLTFGKRELKPNPFAKLLKVSNTLLRRAAQSAESIVLQRIAYKHAIVKERGYLQGSGANQPLGVFTASANGVPTTRDVSTGNTGTEMTFDGLINCKYSLKAQYWQRARWTFHRDGVKQLAKIKDGEGRYIWQPAITAGAPDVLLNMPLDASEYAPNTFTSGLYVGMLCDWSQYMIVDSLQLQIQRLMELLALTNQTGFVSREESDGMPVLAEAFARVKLG